jgi:hypothetical protein
VLVLVRAVEKPTIAVPFVCALAIATRVQFLVLPLAYLAAACRLRTRRLSAPPAAGRADRTTRRRARRDPGARSGSTARRRTSDTIPAPSQHWALTTGSLLPFSLGLAVVPAALFGFALLRRTPIGVISIACPRRSSSDRRR